MPYVTKHERLHIEGEPVNTAGYYCDGPGLLTYALQKVIAGYITRHGLRYHTIAEVLGSIEGLRADFERRVVTPYEERKQRENGDVWEKVTASGDT